ncbi:glycosyltransferase [Devosia sp. Root635]|uniref:glycosyltransferase n=1 Tax=Devosia sp. Root635 TaxID=1736575 RepID=UPI0006F9B3DB|nr:glycosyltransferase [Devosia sp. Root635]KRA45886.1 glycosyl transferase [Devosia sp. Root635]
MRFSIHTLGTRGDMQPYLALARELRRRGHDAMLVAPAQFAAMAAEEAVEFAALPGAFLDLLESREVKDVIGKSSAGFGAGFKLLKHYRGMMGALLDAEWQAAQAFRPDAILHHAKALGAPHIADRLDIPRFLASPLPGFTPTSAFPTPVLPFANLGPLNRISHALMIHGGSVMFSSTVGGWRETTLGLPRRGKTGKPAGTLYGYSPHVLAKPADWGADVAVTGYWFLDKEGWEPDADLAAFLAAGDAPVYVGFGSMPGAEPEQLTGMVVEGLRRARKRGVIATAGGALQRIEGGRDMYFIAGAPHDRLFPLMHATLHHGGAGTTGAALRAGKPTAILPFLGDQPFWARRVQQLGVGPVALDKHKMTVDDLAATFRAMDGAEMRQRAYALGAAIAGENGAGAAADFIAARLQPG